ncbi:MAG: DUF1016 domain-containing protein [Oscillibacter sp.]|nr:DUF1016 domain-containing protein [Oscillibacter sp.]
MRDFYRVYENAPEALTQAMTISWTQNGGIPEATLALQERVWYIREAGQFRRSIPTPTWIPLSTFQTLRAILKKTPPQRSHRKHGKRETQWQTKSRSAGRGSTT